MITTILIIIFMGVFAIWGNIYRENYNHNKLIENLERYEQKEKAKQQKSKIQHRANTRRKASVKESAHV